MFGLFCAHFVLSQWVFCDTFFLVFFGEIAYFFWFFLVCDLFVFCVVFWFRSTIKGYMFYFALWIVIFWWFDFFVGIFGMCVKIKIKTKKKQSDLSVSLCVESQKYCLIFFFFCVCVLLFRKVVRWKKSVKKNRWLVFFFVCNCFCYFKGKNNFLKFEKCKKL